MTRWAIQDQRISFDEFQALELNAPPEERWELVGGFTVRSMAGGTFAHNEIVLNIASRLREHLRARRPECRAYSENIRVDHRWSDTSVLPDVVVRCGPRKPNGTAMTDPLAIIEVLSPSTESMDRGPKWSAYQGIESLGFHAIVDQRRLLVETNTRVDGVWHKRDLQGREQRLEIPSLDFSMTLDEIYEGVIELDRLGRS